MPRVMPTISTKSTTSSTPGFERSPQATRRIASNDTSQGTNNKKDRFSRTIVASSTQQNSATKSQAAIENEMILLRKNIVAPKWPTDSPGDPRNKTIIETFWHSMKAYRTKVRAALIEGRKIDDPDKPKRLEDAIDFKGTCEEMCPDFEKVTRINEHDVQGPEKELAPDGVSLWPSTQKMVKALARSAAGQDAPLPEDVRSPAALRRTVDYLIKHVLASNDLPAVHSFLWDRTRAIRRDFVFLQASLCESELIDQVYCLETIIRFHVVSLHQMIKPGTQAEGFSEQQEVEQLGKALLSLIQAYEDCALQQVLCSNEAEFRAYYVVFNGQNPGILEIVQDWGYELWEHSGYHIKTAVHLVESMQTIWEERGPLKPHQAIDIAQNAYNRFFTILADDKTSYIMACFAEIHFNRVRRAALKTIILSNRRAKAAPKDWDLGTLNNYLHFDNAQEVLDFGLQHGLLFDKGNNHTTFLSLNSNSTLHEPEKRLKQAYSIKMVEFKRGNYSLPDVMLRTVYAPHLADILAQPPSLGVQAQISYPSSRSPNTAAVSTSSADSQRLTMVKPHEETSIAAQQSSPILASPFGLNLPAKSTASTFSQPVLQPLQGAKVFNSIPEGQFHLDSSKAQATNGQVEVQAAAANDVISAPTTNATESSPIMTNKFTFSSPTSLSTESKVPMPGSPVVVAAANSKPSAPNSSLPDFGSSFDPAEPIKVLASIQDTSKPATPLPIDILSTPAFVSERTPALSPANLQPLSSPALLPINPIVSLADWVMNGTGGILDMFTEWKVGGIIAEVYRQSKSEERARFIEAEHDKIEVQVADFRCRSLATKYGYMWRNKAQQNWLRRKGKQDRDARRHMAEELARTYSVQSATSEAGPTNFMKDFNTALSTSLGRSKPRKGSVSGMESRRSLLTYSAGNPDPKLHCNYVNACKKVRRAASEQKLRSKLTTDMITGKTINHPSNGLYSTNTDNSPSQPRRTSFSSLASITTEPGMSRMTSRMSVRDIMIQGLNSTSRIELIPEHSPALHVRKKAHGVQSPYFRHKARGLLSQDFSRSFPRSLPIGRAGINFDASDEKRHSFMQSTQALDTLHLPDDGPAGSGEPKNEKITRSKEWKSYADTSSPTYPLTTTRDHADRDKEIEEAKARARKIMGGESMQSDHHRTRKRGSVVSDDELFAKARRLCDQMDEGTIWFREQREELEKNYS